MRNQSVGRGGSHEGCGRRMCPVPLTQLLGGCWPFGVLWLVEASPDLCLHEFISKLLLVIKVQSYAIRGLSNLVSPHLN